jgi:Zn-finger nucleic acid-binding protein
MTECPKCNTTGDLITRIDNIGVHCNCPKCEYFWVEIDRPIVKYIVTREERKIFTSIDQAELVARKLATEHGTAFYISKVVEKVYPVELKVEKY